jgi:CarboxypepD_reg-like domain
MRYILTFLTAIIFFLNAISSVRLLAQDVVGGYVMDKATNLSIPFAHVMIGKNMTLSTVSNADGFFRMEAEKFSSTDTIIVTHINYNTLSLPVHTFKQGNSKIFLVENITELAAIQVKAKED